MTRGARPRVLLVTDPAFDDAVIVRCVRMCARALPRGAFGVQIRDKRRALPSLRAFAWQLRAVTRDLGAALYLNGDPAMARDVGADGVHLGGGAPSIAEARAAFGRSAWVSVAAHGDDDVGRAIEGGADAVLVSPIFPTRSALPSGGPKAPRGVQALRSARQMVHRASPTWQTWQTGAREPQPSVSPVATPRVMILALGGIDPSSAGSCVAAGADGVALIRGLLERADPGAAARAIHDALARR